MAEVKRAKYLVKEGESVTLFAGDAVEQAMDDGWEEPKFLRSTGEPWNPVLPDDEVPAADAAAEVLKSNEARKAKLDKAEQDAEAKEQAAREKAASKTAPAEKK